MKQDETTIITPLLSQLKDISVQDFLNIGMHDVAYIRKVNDEGQTRFAVHAANGMPLSIVNNDFEAWAYVFENDLEAVTVQ
jgi:hypothetical protein